MKNLFLPLGHQSLNPASRTQGLMPYLLWLQASHRETLPTHVIVMSYRYANQSVHTTQRWFHSETPEYSVGFRVLKKAGLNMVATLREDKAEMSARNNIQLAQECPGVLGVADQLLFGICQMCETH